MTYVCTNPGNIVFSVEDDFKPAKHSCFGIHNPHSAWTICMFSYATGQTHTTIVLNWAVSSPKKHLQRVKAPADQMASTLLPFLIKLPSSLINQTVLRPFL
jgi:hypothetical protein